MGLCCFFWRHVNIWPAVVVLTAFHDAKVERTMLVANIFEPGKITRIAAEKYGTCFRFENPRSPECFKTIGQSATGEMTGRSSCNLQFTLPQKFTVPVELGILIRQKSPAVEMRSYAQRHYKMHIFAVEVVVMVMRNDNQIRLGQVFYIVMKSRIETLGANERERRRTFAENRVG